MPVYELDAAALLDDASGSFAVRSLRAYRQSLNMVTSDGRPLSLRLISIDELPPVPPPCDGEGVESLLARLVARYRYPDALLLLRNPEQALGAEHMAHAQGCGLIAIDSEERELCWDAALSKGMPCFGVRDQLRLDMRREDAASFLAALAFGLFTCHQGLDQLRLHEDRQGVSWECPACEQLETVVVVKEGFAAQRYQGPSGRWHDRGDEGLVRLRLRAGDQRAWTQPRFIMPSAPPAGDLSA